MITFTNNLIDISAIIVGFTAILFYFGKAIADNKVEKYEREDIMIQGLFFTLIFILLPLSITLFLYQKGWIIGFSPWIILIFHILLIYIYSQYKTHKDIKKLGIEYEYIKGFNKKIEDGKKKASTISKLISKTPKPANKSLEYFGIIFKFFENGKVLLFLSTSIFYLVISTVDTANIMFITLNTVLSFINLSLIAIAYGASNAYYPQTKITLIYGKIITGKMLKFGDFIYLVKGTKKYFINKEQVRIIEQGIMKGKS